MTSSSTTHAVDPTLKPDRGRRDPVRGVFSLGRWGGIPVAAHWTGLFTLVLFAEILATSVLPSARPGSATIGYWLVGLVTAAVFLFTLLVHEFAHALTARRNGVGVKGITLWMLGGVTEFDGDAASPRADGLMAGAGPAASLGVGALSALLGWWVGTSTLIGAALGWLGLISVLLAVFNLLPGAPLDGGRILRAVLWARSGDRARAEESAGRAGRVVGFVLVGLGLLEFSLGAVAGLWLALIGWFVINGATAERRHAAVAGLASLRAVDAMTPAADVVPDWWTLEQFFTRATGRGDGQDTLALVDFGGAATGALSIRDVDRVPVLQRDDTRLHDLVRARHGAPLLVARDTALVAVAAGLRACGGIAVVIDDDRHPIGTISSSDLARAARTHADRTDATPGTPVTAQ
ncbi:MAG: site-2 protease family protein [Actinomycetota bacterium]|nr:site-2 protease family protein [Actinomycetota bacterium]